MLKTATVICAKCPKHNKIFGIRAEKRGQEWCFTWAFPLNAEIAKIEGYDSQTVNNTNHDEYPGCPYCHSKELLQCGVCKKLYCYHGEKTSVCPHCNTELTVVNSGWDNISGGGY